MFLIKKNKPALLRVNLLLPLIIFILFFSLNLNSEENRIVLKTGNQKAKVVVKVFSSLTCPHCANFHNKVFLNLDKEFISNGKVRYEHHGFPLDLAALNAEKILGCVESKESKLNLLNELYKKQDTWASGSDINSINQKINDEETHLKNQLALYENIYAEIKGYDKSKQVTVEGQVEDSILKEKSQSIHLLIWLGLAILTLTILIQRMKK